MFFQRQTVSLCCNIHDDNRINHLQKGKRLCALFESTTGRKPEVIALLCTNKGSYKSQYWYWHIAGSCYHAESVPDFLSVRATERVEDEEVLSFTFLEQTDQADQANWLVSSNAAVIYLIIYQLQSDCNPVKSFPWIHLELQCGKVAGHLPLLVLWQVVLSFYRKQLLHILRTTTGCDVWLANSVVLFSCNAHESITVLQKAI